MSSALQISLKPDVKHLKSFEHLVVFLNSVRFKSEVGIMAVSCLYLFYLLLIKISSETHQWK